MLIASKGDFEKSKISLFKLASKESNFTKKRTRYESPFFLPSKSVLISATIFWV